MQKKLLALLLALSLTMGLCACGEKKVDADVDDGNNIQTGQPSEDDNIISQPETDSTFMDSAPQPVATLVNTLSDRGYTFTTDMFSDYSGIEFIHPVECYYLIDFGDGESVYLLDFGTAENAAEHAACYSPDASGYNNMIIDYIAPVHFWQDENVIIEYASQRGELLPLLDELYGEEFAGSGNHGYKPEFTDSLSEIFEGNDIYPTYSFITETDAYISVTAQITTYDYLTLYKYNNAEDFLAHSSSPIEAPVLDLPPLWSDSDNLIIIEYFGSNDELTDILDANFNINVKPLAVNSINYASTHIQSESSDLISVVSSVEELEEYRKSNGDTYGFMLKPTCPVSEDIDEWAFIEEDYTAEWFEYNSLIIARICESSDSVTHEIEMLLRSRNDVTLYITRAEPEAADWALTTHFVLAGVAKSDIDGCEVALNVTPSNLKVRLTEYDPTEIRTDACEDVSDNAVVITSFEDLKSYYESNKEIFDLEHRETVYSDSTIGFADIFDKYNEEWFIDRVLIMVIKNEPSGSISHGIFDVTKSAKSGEITVKIGRAVPNMCTDDMACWHILVGIPRESYRETDTVTATFVNIDPPTE